jgi:hypothetical protein
MIVVPMQGSTYILCKNLVFDHSPKKIGGERESIVSSSLISEIFTAAHITDLVGERDLPVGSNFPKFQVKWIHMFIFIMI